LDDVETEDMLSFELQNVAIPAIGCVVGRPDDIEAKRTKTLADELRCKTKKKEIG
jgi:hypothetical protein